MLYILIYNNNVGDRELVKAVLESMPEITAWRFDMPNCFYIGSDNTAQELADSFSERIPSTQGRRFLFVEASDNRQGFLPRDTWTFMRDKSN